MYLVPGYCLQVFTPLLWLIDWLITPKSIITVTRGASEGTRTPCFGKLWLCIPFTLIGVFDIFCPNTHLCSYCKLNYQTCLHLTFHNLRMKTWKGITNNLCQISRTPFIHDPFLSYTQSICGVTWYQLSMKWIYITQARSDFVSRTGGIRPALFFHVMHISCDQYCIHSQ